MSLDQCYKQFENTFLIARIHQLKWLIGQRYKIATMQFYTYLLG